MNVPADLLLNATSLLAACNARMASIETHLLAAPGVLGVTRCVTLLQPSITSDGRGCIRTDAHDVFELEEFVDAELSDGTALSWQVLCIIDRAGLRIELDVLQNHHQGQDSIRELSPVAISIEELSMQPRESIAERCIEGLSQLDDPESIIRSLLQ